MMPTYDKILTVPFYSQYMDVVNPYWSVRSCGIVSVKMSLDYFGMDSPDLDTLIEDAVAMGAYGDSGWYHDGLIAVGERYGLAPYRKEDMDPKAGIDELRSSVDDDVPVIVSVVQLLLGRRKFHQVLIVGYKLQDGRLAGFFYHDPASTDREQGRALYVSTDIFRVYWRNKAIFMRKGPAA